MQRSRRLRSATREMPFDLSADYSDSQATMHKSVCFGARRVHVTRGHELTFTPKLQAAADSPWYPTSCTSGGWRTVSISKTTTERLYSPPERITLSLGYCICVFWTSAMPPDPHFLRTPNRTNSEITDSFCVFCQTFVGASPRPTLLRLMEDAHACEQIRRHRSGESSGVGKKRILRRKKSV